MKFLIQRSSQLLSVLVFSSLMLACSHTLAPLTLPKRYQTENPVSIAQSVAHFPLTADVSDAELTSYNQAVAALLQKMLIARKPAEMSGIIEVDGVTLRVDGGHDELRLLDPTRFDGIEMIRESEGENQVLHLVKRSGLGVPVVMMQKYDAKKASGKKLFPLNGRHLPATAVIEQEASGQLVLRFHHTRNVQEVAFRGRTRELAYDLSTPLHRSMGDRFLNNMAFRGLFNSDRYLESTGIYLPDVYDPNKIPVVFVHGLKSDPHIWQNAMNEVLRDPVLRNKYQCWYFLYPTGLPVYASAEKLRRMLYIARDHYDPSHSNPQMNQMVLVGHSMGGLLSRMQTIDSGDEIYRSFFVKPLDQLHLKPLTKKLIHDAMVFDRVPFVKRAVFVASPHQGSSMAEIPIMRAVGMLVNPTSNLDAVTMDIRLNAYNDLNPDLWKFKNLGCRSVQTLSPEHPLLKALKRCPTQVPYHSIIAAKQDDEDLWQTSDGVVAYWSSHVYNAQSECVVDGTHSCTRLPDVSEEILRILSLHLRQQ